MWNILYTMLPPSPWHEYHKVQYLVSLWVRGEVSVHSESAPKVPCFQILCTAYVDSLSEQYFWTVKEENGRTYPWCYTGIKLKEKARQRKGKYFPRTFIINYDDRCPSPNEYLSRPKNSSRPPKCCLLSARIPSRTLSSLQLDHKIIFSSDSSHPQS